MDSRNHDPLADVGTEAQVTEGDFIKLHAGEVIAVRYVSIAQSVGRFGGSAVAVFTAGGQPAMLPGHANLVNTLENVPQGSGILVQRLERTKQWTPYKVRFMDWEELLTLAQTNQAVERALQLADARLNGVA